MPENIKLIPLTQGLHAYVDAADYEALSAVKWRAKRSGSTFYAVRSDRRRECGRAAIMMHRVLMNPAPGLMVDHINHDGLDNRRANLRACTRTENKRNRTSQRGSSSQFLGVFWNGQTSKWRAQITINGRQLYLGSYTDETAAARAYDRAAREHHGEFSNPNFNSD